MTTTTTNEEIDLGVLAGSEVDFRSETMYFLVLDRFEEGNPGKAREADAMYDSTHADWHKYWGGDLQGLVNRLDYLEKDLGISAVWTTPLFEQVRTMTVGDSPRAPIHGYWTSDFKRINPRWMNDPSEKRLFTRDDTVFDKLLEALHGRGMKFVLDIVCNHSSPQTVEGKGRLYDDGKLIADFDDDRENWYHHYGETLDWSDEWQVQNCELAGLATFNENNILFRDHIKDAIKLWIGKGVDALRIDTVKHMPIWFWQEFTSDMSAANPNLFKFGEWIHNHPDIEKSVTFANKAGMSLLDFGYCHAVRYGLSGLNPEGFLALQKIFDLDGNYSASTELVTFFENHDMPRLQSMGVTDAGINLALILLMTSRGIPCIYYGCEQYLHDDTDGGDDPYNRPMMMQWGETTASRIIKVLAAERKRNTAVQWGGQWPKFVDEESYVFLRRYRDSRCLVFLNKGPRRELELGNLEFPDGDYSCLLTGRPVTIAEGKTTVNLRQNEGIVLAVRGRRVRGQAIIRLQVNGAPTRPGDRLAVIGDCEELGRWDLRGAYELECVNSNTWFGEIPFNAIAGMTMAYKYVILSRDENEAPLREPCLPRRRLVIPRGMAKWRDHWDQ